MRNIFKKGLFIAIACLMANAVWAVAPTLSVNESSQGSTTFLKAYTTEGITLSSSANFSSGAVQLGNTPSSYDQHYFEVLASSNAIDSVSFLISGNGSNKSIQAPVFGWANTATSNTADTYRILDPVTVSANSYTAAQWFTYKFDGANVKCLRIYRSTKSISSTNPAYTGSSTALGSGQTIKIYGIKVWLAGGTTPDPGPTPGPVAVTGVSLNKTSTSIAAGQTEQLTATVAPSNATDQTVSWQTSNPSAATVSSTGLVTGVAAGTATITVTTTDGGKTATCTVTVTSGGGDPTPVVPTPVPSSDLTIHQPEVYEAPSTAGGYNTPLVVFGSREYEVYYINRDANSKLSVATSSTDKAGAITTSDDSNNCTATDGWISVKSDGSGGDTNGSAVDEFNQSIRKVNMKAGSEILLRVKGFDQFSLYGKDNSNNAAKCLEVYINDNKQTMTPNNNYSVRRFSLNGESLIRITALSTSSSVVVAFSLRVAQEPRTKYLEGNDTTQVIYQTQEPLPVYYYTKYSRIANARTELEWTGGTAAGITLQNAGQDELGDTIALAGLANCQTGVYHYDVVNYYNNVETNRVSGSFKVATYLRSLSRDSVFEAYTNEPMDEISFKYIALSPDSVHLTWKDNKAPAGVSGRSNTEQSKYSIGGTPTKAGTYDFTVSIGGGNSISGRLEIKSLDLGSNPIIYLYKNSLAYENDGVYKYLTSSAGGSLNLITRKASENGPRDSYSKYKWILISEDVDADNPEVLAIIRDNAAGLPVLNMKGFTYATGRLGWGEPDNGTMDTVSKNGCNIYVMQPEHPIFSGINFDRTTGMLKVLEKADKRGIMPINVTKQGSLCLATGYTRDIEDYYKDGELQTVIHEVPVGGGRNKNYICFPLSNTKDNLTAQGKALLKNIVNYITGTQHFTNLPELEMTGFSVAGYTAHINQSENLIELEMTKEQFEEADSLRAAKPIITVKDSKTHAIPASNEEVDLRYTTFLPKTFVVTDYINRRAYSFKLTVTRPQGIDEVYTVGEWVNIFDIYGRKITTTNEDIYTMDLPHGIYLVVTENGNTIKIMK